MTTEKYERIAINNQFDCWDWQKALSSNGYGMLSISGEGWRAHRLMWTIFNGPIPAGKLVLHSCDNRKCCNPKHLFLGDYSDNLEDCYIKGRRDGTYRGLKRRAKRREVIKMGNAPGENHSTAKLTEKQASAIFASKEKGVVLAKRHKVSVATISKIRTGKLWRHLTQL